MPQLKHPLPDAVISDDQRFTSQFLPSRYKKWHATQQPEGPCPRARGEHSRPVGEFSQTLWAYVWLLCGLDYTHTRSTHTHAAHPGWYAAAHGCTCTPQRAGVPTSATNEAAYARFFPPPLLQLTTAAQSEATQYTCENTARCFLFAGAHSWFSCFWGNYRTPGLHKGSAQKPCSGWESLIAARGLLYDIAPFGGSIPAWPT